MDALALAKGGIVGRRMPLGDKEIAVRIRSNSHYRISTLWGGQVGMLIGLFGAKALGKSLLGNEGVDAANDKVGKATCPKRCLVGGFFARLFVCLRPLKGAFILSFS